MSAGVLNQLEKSLFKTPAHIMLREVRNATGYASGVTRSADALVVSVWPSRGIWFACVEVKVSRGDWLRELKTPEKAEEISRFCDYVWIATPPGIVHMHELPAQWGLVEVDGSKTKVKKQAPKKTRTALNMGFVAAVLRNRHAHEGRIKQLVRDELRSEEIARGEAAAAPVSSDVAELRARITNLQYLVDNKTRQIEQHEQVLKEFEQASGVSIGHWNARRIGESVKLSEYLDHAGLEELAKRFERLAEQARKADREIAQQRLPLSAALATEENVS